MTTAMGSRNLIDYDLYLSHGCELDYVYFEGQHFNHES